MEERQARLDERTVLREDDLEVPLRHAQAHVCRYWGKPSPGGGGGGGVRRGLSQLSLYGV